MNEIKSLYFETLQDIFAYAPDIDEWIALKRELIRSLPLKYRTLFQKRNPYSKEIQMNEFEFLLAQAWTFLTKKPMRYGDETIFYKEI